jgi:patatin-like phospholipase/acyl hydrolase
MRRILALDGGGVRGVIELAFLERIENMLRARSADPTKFRLCDYFDLVGGTSTGSIIAAAIATGRSVAEIRSIYERIAPKVFRRRWWRLTGLQSRFSAAPISDELRREFPQMKLDDPRIRTLLALVTKRMDTGSPWIVSNVPTAPYWNAPSDNSSNGNRHLSVAALIRASTAAPFYFGPERIAINSLDTGIFIDGGVTPFNNPAIALLMLATMDAYGLRWPLSPDGLLLVSIGTEMVPRERVCLHRAQGSDWRLSSLEPYNASVAGTFTNALGTEFRSRRSQRRKFGGATTL